MDVRAPWKAPMDRLMERRQLAGIDYGPQAPLPAFSNGPKRYRGHATCSSNGFSLFFLSSTILTRFSLYSPQFRIVKIILIKKKHAESDDRGHQDMP